ncbi:MAG: hypothetical protein JSR18_00910 [Proteobacteria bacterium]|nr:hypothetical protein [Pseudomonadota bacterium]
MSLPALPIASRLAVPAVLLLAVTSTGIAATAFAPTPLPHDHPMVGVWNFALPDGDCVETYVIRADGTTAVVSGEERSESAYEISAQPSARGFYRWSDRVTRNNGKADCGGGHTPVGQQTTLYVRMAPDASAMLLCAQENFRQCIGPLVRARGDDL